MSAWLWIPATLGAATFQVFRNALQREVMGAAGPWGATLVRFVFGLPFSVAFAGVALAARPDAHLSFSLAFWASALSGALAQVLATAALLEAMRRGGFAVGTALQQSSLPLSAAVGLALLGDRLSARAWIGVALATPGLVWLAWPQRTADARPVSGGLFGLLSGLLFGYGLNAFRHADLALDAARPATAALVSLVAVQAAQSLGLGAWLAACDRAALNAIRSNWRKSLGAGAFGALASAGWFIAVGLAAAAPVRALGVIETPIAALVGRRLFRERVGAARAAAGAAVVAGVLLTALG